MSKPQVIFLDAVGTLFGIRGSVGEIYAAFAHQIGVEADPMALERAFIQSFRAAPRAAFPGVSARDLPDREFAWWQEVAAQSFARIGLLQQFPDFGPFFRHLFDHFAGAEPWEVYPEVPQALTSWRSQGIELGIISNFDSRLYPVLAALDLADFFSSVTISTQAGFAKPAPEIFQLALAKHHCPATAAWHIGDSWREDYQGATAAGLGAFWLNREPQLEAAPPEPTPMLAALTAWMPVP